MHGTVHRGGADATSDDSVGIIARGPSAGLDPKDIVAGFLLASQAGPTAVNPFATAREYLTDAAQSLWRPYTRVLVVDGTPSVSLGQVAAATPPNSAQQDSAQPDPTQPDDSAERVRVVASGTKVASVDTRGVYSEIRVPAATSVTFDLVQVEGQWRIDALEDGLLISSPVFTSTYHRTEVMFPTADGRYWVPDVRWFPQQTWRTNAVAALLEGPQDHLADVVTSPVPAGTALAVDSVTVGVDDTYQVILTDHILAASRQERGLLATQIHATLNDGEGALRDVTLMDRGGAIPVTYTSGPGTASTEGNAVVISADEVWQVREHELEPLYPGLILSDLDPTALAVGRGIEPAIVVRDGTDRIVRITDGVVLYEGTDLASPAVDRYGAMWTASANNAVVAVDVTGQEHRVAAPWLAGYSVATIRIAPNGAQVALVAQPSGEAAAVMVAGIVRDANGTPLSLTEPVTVGASIVSVSDAVWQASSVLAIVGQDAGSRVVYLAGVGGLDSPGGLPRTVSGVTNPLDLTASVGTGNILAIDSSGLLHLRQSSALWPVVGQRVDLVSYPG
jgi:hypothetical protein